MAALRPFCDGDTFSMFRNVMEKLRREIEELENSYILKASASELEDHFTAKGTITPLLLHVDQWGIEGQQGVAIDVSRMHRFDGFTGDPIKVRGTRLDIAIPFEGDPILWKLRPSTYSFRCYPDINVLQDRIVISIQFIDTNTDKESLRRDIDRQVESLATAAATLRRDTEQHNSNVPGSVKAWLAEKRAKAERAIDLVGALGIPIKRRDVPATLSVPVQRKKLVLARPAVPPEPFKSEPVLQDAVYEEVLKSLRAMSLVIERNPHSFQKLDEERLRDQFLINLNSLFEGQATGETFNGAGKTDILIRVEDRTVFIAECKFWGGAAKFGEAIDQLLSYLTWRDCKCALLVFNRNKDSVAVLNKMHETMTQRKEHRKTLSFKLDEGGRYILVKHAEPGREIVVSTLLFDVPTTP